MSTEQSLGHVQESADLSSAVSLSMAKTKAKINAERRHQRKIDKLRESEARWLQKVLFDLGKARDARASLSETTGDELNPLIELDDGTKVDLDKLSEIIERRVDDLMDALGRSSHNRRKG